MQPQCVETRVACRRVAPDPGPDTKHSRRAERIVALGTAPVKRLNTGFTQLIRNHHAGAAMPSHLASDLSSELDVLFC
jgi:hypothetical protein